MRNLVEGAQFRRDVRLARKRGNDMAKLREIILLLVEGNPLPARCKDHPLGGEWKHFRDCHIEPRSPERHIHDLIPPFFRFRRSPDEE